MNVAFMAIAVCHFNPFSIYFQVLTTYFSLLRQQTQCQNIKEDSELDFIHTLFKKMSHPTTVSLALLYSYTFHILGHSM